MAQPGQRNGATFSHARRLFPRTHLNHTDPERQEDDFMRQSEIDTLTRRIAQRTGRRALATGILGGLLTALLPGLSAVDAAPPKKRGRGKQPRCKKPTRR